MSRGGFTCSACGKVFGSEQLFMWHRVGKLKDSHPHYGRLCRNSLHLALHGAVFRAGVWRTPMSQDTLARLRRG